MSEKLGMTFVSFEHCELEGEWANLTENHDSDTDLFKSQEDNAKINLRSYDKEKSTYYMKKNAVIKIRNNVLRINKQDFSDSA